MSPFDRGTGLVRAPAGITTSVNSPGETLLERRGERWVFVKGRLREDVPMARAAASLGAIIAGLHAAYPESNTEWSAFHGASVVAPGSAAW